MQKKVEVYHVIHSLESETILDEWHCPRSSAITKVKGIASKYKTVSTVLTFQSGQAQSTLSYSQL